MYMIGNNVFLKTQNACIYIKKGKWKKECKQRQSFSCIFLIKNISGLRFFFIITSCIVDVVEAINGKGSRDEAWLFLKFGLKLY